MNSPFFCLLTNRKKPGLRVPRISRLQFVRQKGQLQFGLLRLPLEKTIMTRKTDEIILPKTNQLVDPGTDVLRMLQFRRTSPNPALRAEPNDFLFVTSRGHPVDSKMFNLILDKLCHVTNLPRDRITPHSLRIGGATTLIQRGIPDVVVQMLGRWNSDAYRSYVRLDKQYLSEFCAKMCS